MVSEKGTTLTARFSGSYTKISSNALLATCQCPCVTASNALDRVNERTSEIQLPTVYHQNKCIRLKLNVLVHDQLQLEMSVLGMLFDHILHILEHLLGLLQISQLQVQATEARVEVDVVRVSESQIASVLRRGRKVLK